MGNGWKVPILRPFLLYHVDIEYEILVGDLVATVATDMHQLDILHKDASQKR